jgi:transposase-like protein
MDKKYQEISLLEFQEKYRSEEDCQNRLFELRWPEGFVCPRCKHSKYYNLPKRGLFQCKGCGYQASLTAGTVMHGTRTPLRIWFWAIFLFASDKRGLSALALSKRLQISYWRAWTMLQKIRQAMRERDSHYKLAGIVEIDDSFFGGPKPGEDKRGRGSSKTTVIVEASTCGEGVGFAKMTVVDQLDAKSISKIVVGNITENQTVKTDGLPAYNVVAENGHTHQREIVKGKKAHTVLKWTHILVSNAKAFILGTFHGIDRKHLQGYLDEFCYRFNRRRWEGQLFDRLVTACVTCPTFTFSELTQ